MHLIAQGRLRRLIRDQRRAVVRRAGSMLEAARPSAGGARCLAAASHPRSARPSANPSRARRGPVLETPSSSVKWRIVASAAARCRAPAASPAGAYRFAAARRTRRRRLAARRARAAEPRATPRGWARRRASPARRERLEQRGAPLRAAGRAALEAGARLGGRAEDPDGPSRATRGRVRPRGRRVALGRRASGRARAARRRARELGARLELVLLREPRVLELGREPSQLAVRGHFRGRGARDRRDERALSSSSSAVQQLVDLGEQRAVLVVERRAHVLGDAVDVEGVEPVGELLELVLGPRRAVAVARARAELGRAARAKRSPARAARARAVAVVIVVVARRGDTYTARSAGVLTTVTAGAAARRARGRRRARAATRSSSSRTRASRSGRCGAAGSRRSTRERCCCRDCSRRASLSAWNCSRISSRAPISARSSSLRVIAGSPMIRRSSSSSDGGTHAVMSRHSPPSVSGPSSMAERRGATRRVGLLTSLCRVRKSPPRSRSSCPLFFRPGRCRKA